MKTALPLVLALTGLGVQAKAATPEQTEFFESRIRPVLAQDCYECHSTATKRKGGLLLDTRAGWQEGGDSGPAIVPGDAKKSLLVQSIKHEHEDLAMPKNGAKLDDKVIADFEKWINEGAHDPREIPPTKEQIAQDTDWKAVLERRKQWWAFQPLKNSAGLKSAQALVKGAPHENPVDALIQAKLKEQGLPQSGAGDAAVVLRRLSFIITGLPPSVEDLAKVKSKPEALSSMIDAMLASPRYGEAWARHWMDWVRYAESHGSEGDAPIPYAWRYRDYLIRAFNADVPYPQMVREAVAGDLLARPRINKELGINESALGIGQLRMVLHGFSPTDSLDEMVTFTDNQIDVVSKAFQGLTVSCARCHNHKFDAISQTDFYSWFGIFSSTHPAVIDVNLPDRGNAEREQLMKLKGEIKAAVAAAWLKAAKGLPKAQVKLQSQPPGKVIKRWDPRKDTWYGDGLGIKQGPTKAGEFSLASNADKVIGHVHSSGIYSGLISARDRGVLVSPRFKCEGGTLWIKSSGSGLSRARYIVQNYPRTGTIHKAKEFKEPADEVPAWRPLDLEYWKGDDIFIQCTTAADMPAEFKLQNSWFGISEAVITQGNEPPQSEVFSGEVLPLVEAWQSNTLTDAQAELLDAVVREGKLPNDVKSLPDVAPLLVRYREIEVTLPEPTRAPGVMEADSYDAPLFIRGDHKQPAQMVPRYFLDGIDPTPFRTRQSGRLELAEHLVSPENPLSARVIVNRIWHHVFGRGLVGTPDNFGKLGELPSHPELLDWLAVHFQESGGSIKELVRLMVSSKTFQAGSSAPVGALAKDPENRLLSHWTIRRLEAEPIRDSLFAISGRLEPEMYGEPVASNDSRRSVYMKVIRNGLDDFLTAFDMPVPMTTRGRRDVTNVPAQSLAMLNDQHVRLLATTWARKVAKLQGSDEERIQGMFMTALGRPASPQEVTACNAFMKQSGEAAKAQQDEVDALQKRIASLQKKIDGTLGPLRARLTEGREVKVPEGLPEPYAEWDFEKDANDLRGRLPLTLEGEARIENGALVLDGRTGFARSAPIPRSLAAKTLEAWVLLDTLDQKGGGVLTVQDLRGNVFDSIVFAENEPGEWLAGSDFHRRTKDFLGAPEADAAKRPVHIAIVYAGEKVNCFRDGVPYGKGFKTEERAVFEKNGAQVLLGCRHGGAGGNKLLRGRILRARLYDKPLTVVDIEKSRLLESAVISDRDVFEALTESQRTQVRDWQSEADKLAVKAEAIEQRLERIVPATAGWESLALSIVNLKEFLFLK